MKLLISTQSNAQFSVAIGDKRIMKFKIVKKPYRQSELLLKTIDKLLRNSSQPPTAVFVAQGPGQFSALRIGIATANALAFAWNVPIAGVKLKKEWAELPEAERMKKIWQEIVQLKIKKSKRFVRPVYGGKPNIS